MYRPHSGPESANEAALRRAKYAKSGSALNERRSRSESIVITTLQTPIQRGAQRLSFAAGQPGWQDPSCGLGRARMPRPRIEIADARCTWGIRARTPGEPKFKSAIPTSESATQDECSAGLLTHTRRCVFTPVDDSGRPTDAACRDWPLPLRVRWPCSPPVVSLGGVYGPHLVGPQPGWP
jgi:hypothetical protein